MTRNLVVCLDGTRNEPETGVTNVTRVFDIAAKVADQLVYYDPGVGTMGARGAVTRAGKTLTRLSGLAMGHGIRENLEEAYSFLMRTFQPGDRLFIFGFSRGAYTALALAGILRTIGLLRAGADNLVPYAVKLYTQSGKPGQGQEFWDKCKEFNRSFGNPGVSTFGRQTHYLGIWDAVKTVGWFNWKARFEEARWPFTRTISGVRYARHALAINERRRPYAAYRFDGELVSERGGDLREMWFAGVHSDVGGFFKDDHQLSDLALQWVVEGAASAGLVVDEKSYRRHLGVDPGQPLAEDVCLGRIHHNQWGWALIGFGWRSRTIWPGDNVHPSVLTRIERTRGTKNAYNPKLPTT